MGCGICGGALVEIRGRYPHTAKREVCPTCLAERMDQVRELADPEYGRAWQAESILTIGPDGIIEKAREV